MQDKTMSSKVAGESVNQPMGKLSIEKNTDISSFVKAERELGIPVPSSATERSKKSGEVKV